MAQATRRNYPGTVSIKKTRTGISGFDEITDGGLPQGRPALICGQAGAGKTLFSIEFIIHGALQFGEPGVIMCFEERAEDLETNVASLGFNLKDLQKKNLLRIDYVQVNRSEIEETGEYDLEGLFIRLEHAIDSIGAKRVMLDTIENLFAGLANQGMLRAEIRRLFTWLKDKGVTAIITGESGDQSLTRQGLEEYVSDCVILLEHRIVNRISTRLLRVVKYRGSAHGTNEYPFLIDEEGISVLPVTSLRMDAPITSARISSGIPDLDEMLERKGFFRGSSVLVSGTAGTGKTSLAALFAAESCRRKEKCLYFAFEESAQQIVRNMRSIGLDLGQYVQSGMLHISSQRPTNFGLEMHLVAIHKMVKKIKPKAVVLDPITNLITIGSMLEIKSMLIRLIDFLQNEGITVYLTALVSSDDQMPTDEGVSSLVDAWILVRDLEMNGERNRGIYVIKSRGMQHSNKVREFIITDDGVRILEVAIGEAGVLVGSARMAKELDDVTGEEMKTHARSGKDREIQRRRRLLEAQILSLREEFDSVQEALTKNYTDEDLKQQIMEKNRKQLTRQSPKNRNDKRK